MCLVESHNIAGRNTKVLLSCNKRGGGGDDDSSSVCLPCNDPETLSRCDSLNDYAVCGR